MLFSGSDVTATGQNGRNVYLNAAYAGNVEILNLLELDCRVDKSHVDNEGNSAVILANRNGNSRAVTHLVSYGFNPVNGKLNTYKTSEGFCVMTRNNGSYKLESQRFVESRRKHTV